MSYKITKPVRLIELFGGIGSQAMAMRDLGVKFEHYRLIEFDKYAIKSYNAIHGTHFDITDITNVKGEDLGIEETDKYVYLMTYSFPCQSLSLAGKQHGMKKGSGTRSGLLWEVERLLNETKNLPQVLLMENVPQVHGKKNIDDFNQWILFLESKGYKNYWQDLNAKDYGVAQNRNRCFMISLLSDLPYVFPEPIKLSRKLSDYLEDDVDEKYYINGEKADKLIEGLIARGVLPADKDIIPYDDYNSRVPTDTDIIGTMTSTIGHSALRNGHKIIERKVGGVLLSDQATKFDKFTDVACTLMARDYKGPGNQSFNMVIEHG